MQAYRSKKGEDFRVELDPQGDYARLEEGETLRASIMEDGTRKPLGKDLYLKLDATVKDVALEMQGSWEQTSCVKVLMTDSAFMQVRVIGECSRPYANSNGSGRQPRITLTRES